MSGDTELMAPAKGQEDRQPASQSGNTPAPSQPDNMLAIIHAATQNDGIDPEKLGKLLDVQERWEANEARKGFTQSLTAFQSECPIIEKLDMAHGKPYARMDRIWRTIRPLMKKHGLSVIWTEAVIDKDTCTMSGYLSHVMGHQIPIKRQMAVPGMIKGTNEAQRDGSASTYCRRYATCDVLGVITGDDDDGNAGASEYISEDQANKLEELIELSGCNRQMFYETYGSTGLGNFPSVSYRPAVKMLEQRINRKSKGGE